MSLTQRWCLLKARTKQKRLKNLLAEPGSVLDVGCGNGALVHLLSASGHAITALDVVNRSRFTDVKPQIYNGKAFPFSEHEFDTVMMITMLHHTPEPETLIKEAKRVGKRILIMEEVYTNSWQRRLTFFVDSLVNWEFRNHPHSNKSDEAWKQCFATHGLEIKNYRKDRFLLFFTQTIYLLEPIVAFDPQD